MLPRLYYYYINNDNIECQIISSVNDIKSYLYLPSLIHLSFDAPLPNIIKEEFIKLPKLLYSSISFAHTNLPDSWLIDISQEIILKDIIIYPVKKAFGENKKIKIEEWELLESFTQKKDKDKDNIFLDYRLNLFDWSARTSNVFKNNSIIYMSDLVRLNYEILMRFPNFGKNSYNEIILFLSSHNLRLDMDLTNYTIKKSNEYEEISPLVKKKNRDDQNSNIIDDFFDSLKLLDDTRLIDIIKKRAGATPKQVSMTLEEIGQEYKVTRERIRQLEVKGLKNLKKLPIAWEYQNYWSNKINKLLADRVYPLTIESLKDFPEFSKIDKNIEVLKFIITHLDTKFYYINEFGYSFICRIHREELDNLIKKTYQFLELLENKTITEIEKETLFLFNINSRELHNKVLYKCLENSTLENNSNGEKVLIKFYKNQTALAAVHGIFNTSRRFLKNSDIEEIAKNKFPEFHHRNIMNRIIEVKGVYPMPSHGSWGKLDYFDFNPEEVKEVLNSIDIFIEKFVNSKNNQFHSREIIQKYINSLNVCEDLKNPFVIAALIQENFDIPYIGRSVFSNPNSELGKRIHIHNVMVDVLIKNNRPMNGNDLIKEADKFRSVAEQYMIQPKAPLKKIGSNLWALDYWEKNL